jgi:toxin ParE1/3/4
MRARIRPQSWLDVEEAMRYLKHEAGEQTAVRFFERVRQTLKQLSRQPEMGRPRLDLEPAGIRSWRVAKPFEKWLVFYRIVEDGLEILRIKHGAVDIPSLFLLE